MLNPSVPESIFSAAAPGLARRIALVAESAPGEAAQIAKALAACGATPVMLGPNAEAEIASRGRHVDLVVVDADFGGRKQGLRLVETAHRRTQATVIMVGADVECAAGETSAERCHVLHHPVHERQLRATIRLALAQRTARAMRKPEAEPRQHELETALRQIGTVVRSLSGPSRSEGDAGPALDELRPRERQIVDLLLTHHRVPAISGALGISAHTVRNHLKNVYRRLGVHSQQELLDQFRQV